MIFFGLGFAIINGKATFASLQKGSKKQKEMKRFWFMVFWFV